ncbi:hypothetical protein [Clostridium botulinum]|uniref:hypothetical protein n=1 Tax=Clostridium botulinum TaxID=1491 RepID=UPI001C9A7C1E|nr:hypothetical protein [Clostridium botulinum]MBY6809322.1 hypothetical protein [Clostridium botulinum]MBY6822764.1 hypothetical protein [Clostridium botulinum]MBY6833376.1 hypothetical protein [Clostridium botulinum]MBY6971437.1 hypothetical protein [Clostridium botulinum]
MNINVSINYPDDMKALEEKASKLMASILVKKLQPKEIETLIGILKDDNQITW